MKRVKIFTDNTIFSWNYKYYAFSGPRLSRHKVESPGVFLETESA